jgi:hypothetical protein
VNITWDTNSGSAISAPGDDHQQGFQDKERAMSTTSMPVRGGFLTNSGDITCTGRIEDVRVLREITTRQQVQHVSEEGSR